VGKYGVGGVDVKDMGEGGGGKNEAGGGAGFIWGRKNADIRYIGLKSCSLSLEMLAFVSLQKP